MIRWERPGWERGRWERISWDRGRRYDDGWRYNNTGYAILGGIIGGLIVGAILKSTSASNRDTRYSNVMSTDYEPDNEETEEAVIL